MAKVVTMATGVVGGVTYGESVVAGDMVGWSSGKLARACPVSGEVVAAVGLAMAAYDANEVGSMALGGEVSGFEGLTAGATQYLSLSTPGAFQEAVPTGSGNLKQVIGYAVAADRVAVVLQDAGAAIA